MKKKVIFITVLALSIILLLGVLSACKPSEETELEKMKKLVTFQHTQYLTAKGESFEVAFSCGVKEENYTADGIIGNIKSFTSLEVTPLDYRLADKKLSYKLISEKGELSGELTKNTLGISFSAKIENIDTVGIPTRVIITCEDVNDDMTFEDKMSEILTADKAIETAMTEFAERIAEERTEGGFQREVSVKLIHDDSVYESPYYWLVSFVKGDYDYWAVVIDPVSGKVMSKQ